MDADRPLPDNSIVSTVPAGTVLDAIAEHFAGEPGFPPVAGVFIVQLATALPVVVQSVPVPVSVVVSTS